MPGTSSTNRLTDRIDRLEQKKYTYAVLGNGMRTFREDGPWANDHVILTNRFGQLNREWTQMDTNEPRVACVSSSSTSGLYYYRFYDRYLQRWLNRDPIEELGGPSRDAYDFCDCRVRHGKPTKRSEL